MNRSVLIGICVLVAIVVIGGAYGLFGERLHNQNVNATTAVVTPDGIRTEGPQRPTP